MSYKLTLTSGDREAVDWVDYRYSNGHDLYDLLCEGEWSCDWDTGCGMPDLGTASIHFRVSTTN